MLQKNCKFILMWSINLLYIFLSTLLQSAASEDLFDAIGNELSSAVNLLSSFGVVKESPSIKLLKPRTFEITSALEVQDNLYTSFISVCPASSILRLECICKERFHDISVAKNKLLTAFATIAVDTKHGVVIVSYKPALTIKDYLTTSDYTLIKLPGAPRGTKVHRGFYRYIQSIRKDAEARVEVLLSQPMYTNYPVHVTGYSLGGAMSTLSTPDWANFMIRKGFNNPLIIYSYAGPRVGNQMFADYVATFKVKLMRYTNHNDIVTHYPPRSNGYTHIGAEFHEGSSDLELTVCDQSYDEDPKCGLGAARPYSFRQHVYPQGEHVPRPTYC